MRRTSWVLCLLLTTLSASGCRTTPTPIEPFCPEGQDLRRNAERKAEFVELLDRKQAPALRGWMLWMNSTYRYNCKLAGKQP